MNIMDNSNFSSDTSPSEAIPGLHHINPQWYGSEPSNVSEPAKPLEQIRGSELDYAKQLNKDYDAKQTKGLESTNHSEHPNPSEPKHTSEELTRTQLTNVSKQQTPSVQAALVETQQSEVATTPAHMDGSSLGDSSKAINATEILNVPEAANVGNQSNNPEHVYTSEQPNAAGEITVGRTLDVDV